MKIELTETELDSIARQIEDRLQARLVANGSSKAIEEASKKYTEQMIPYYLSSNEITMNVQDMLKPSIEKYLRKNSSIINAAIYEHMSTESFKKLEIDALRRRIHQLEEEE